MLRLVSINALVLVGALLLAEGAASYVLLARSMANRERIAERQHTRHDPDLGWVNVPNLHVPDMYGPGISLRTNGQGFRNDREFSPAPAPGKVRAICSGDSYTLGYGVGDAHPWCARLADLNPRLETVNMGQGGYGTDQAYLWYKRDAQPLQHQLHLFAFVTLDFLRMQTASFYGYAKPTLRLENGRLVPANVPVPTTTYHWGWLVRRLQVVDDLRSADLLRRLLRRVGALAPQRDESVRDDETRRVLARLFEELRDLNVARSSRLVLVYLPGPPRHLAASQPDWTEFVEHTAQRLGILLVNARVDFDRLPRDERDKLFIPEDGHLSVEGNAVVAQLICRAISRVPPLADDPGPCRYPASGRRPAPHAGDPPPRG